MKNNKLAAFGVGAVALLGIGSSPARAAVCTERFNSETSVGVTTDTDLTNCEFYTPPLTAR